MSNEQYAILMFATGISGEDSMLAWAGVPFQTFDHYEEAAEECNRVNDVRVKNSLPACAFVCKGFMTQHLGFVPSKE